jgi:hypothetical protein
MLSYYYQNPLLSFYSMKLKLLIAGLLAVTIAHAQPVFNWVNTFGSTDYETVFGATTDATGNIYITGQFNGTVDFDPGPGTQTLSALTADDGFICKFDAAGHLLWAKSLDLICLSIAVDAAGNVYTAGNFGSSTTDLDPGPGTFSLPFAATRDIFILKLDAAGDFVWAKGMGGAGMDYASSIAVDAAGNVYTAGTFSGTVDFDPGPGTQPVSGGGRFISKLDASGNYAWAKSLAGQFPNAIALDGTGNVYITGYFFDATTDFDPGTGTYNLPNAGNSDAYISKLDASGNFVWAKGMAGAGADLGKSITLDASGNIYVIGSFVNSADFDPGIGSTILTTPTNAKDVFVTKLDALGNLVWAKNMGGDDDDVPAYINVDALGNVYTAGFFKNTADFDPNAGTQYLTAAISATNLFFSKLDASGNYVWAFPLASGVYEPTFPWFIIANGDDNIYAIGDFADNVDFDPGPSAQAITSAGLEDLFIVHLTASSLPLSLLQFKAENNDKATQLAWQTTQEENTAFFSIERSANGKTFTAIGSVPAANTAFKNNYAFTDAQPLAGTSFYRLKMIDIDGKFTYSRTVSVREKKNDATLLVSPNPAKDILYVQAKGSEQVTLQITGVNGRILQQQKIALNGNTSFSVNIQSLPAGNYYLVLKGRETKQVQQFLKQ